MKIHLGPYRKNRKIEVRIDDYDVWNLDHTLSMIISECLKKLRDNIHGYPMEFAPPDVREDGINYGGEGGGIKAWRKIIDQMIEGFELMTEDDWPAIDPRKISKAQHALYLFSHYYMNLWD